MLVDELKSVWMNPYPFMVNLTPAYKSIKAEMESKLPAKVKWDDSSTLFGDLWLYATVTSQKSTPGSNTGTREKLPNSY